MEQGMRNAFQALDSNGNGKLQETELRHILRNLGDMLKGEEIEELMSEAKTDHNGYVV
jgi:Ca2+-binding EF-hand superfamily protein